jgi:integrase
MAGKNGGKPRKTRAAIPGLELHRGKYRWRPMVDGTRHMIPLAATTLANAIAEVSQLQKRPLRKVVTEWAGSVDLYLAAGRGAKRLSQGTRNSRGPVLHALGRDMGLASPRALTPAVAQRWLALLHKRALPIDADTPAEISKSTVLHYVRDLRAFVTWCLDKGMMAQDPTRDFELERPEEKLRDVWVPSSRIAELLADARAENDRDMEFILGLGFECSMRRGEISACRPEWFDLAQGTVRIPPSDPKAFESGDEGPDWKRKGREGRSRDAVIPLSGVMLDIIRRHRLPSPFVIAPEKTTWGKHRYRFEFRKRFAKFMAKHGLAHVTIHDLRRSFASNRVSAGVPIEKVANWMGINIKTAWKNYARFLPSDADINRGSATVAAVVPAPFKREEASPPDFANLLNGVSLRLAAVEKLLASGEISKEERDEKRRQILDGF